MAKPVTEYLRILAQKNRDRLKGAEKQVENMKKVAEEAAKVGKEVQGEKG